MCFSIFFFFFFSSRRRHTRSTRDWSSDVCSSDLIKPPLCFSMVYGIVKQSGGFIFVDSQPQRGTRSEERRVGKECRSRWSPDHQKKKKKKQGGEKINKISVLT